MLKKVKVSKLALVIFLTVLIWVWADLANDVTRSLYTATIVIGRTKPNLLASFPQGNNSIDVNEIKLKGPASKINGMEQLIANDPLKLEFPLILEQFGKDKPGDHTISVKDIIERSGWIKENGLSIEKCEPAEITVNVLALTLEDIDVQCFDEQNLQRDLENAQTVSMYVPSDWGGKARVDLTSADVQKAVQQPIFKKPYIVLSNGQKKEADTTIEIKLSPLENTLEKRKVNNATYGICLSENLSKGQYEVEVLNVPDILSIEILTTQAAKDAYEEQRFQVIIEVKDGDDVETREKGFVRRTLTYLLPEDYVRENQIKLAQEKEEAEFKLIPVTPVENP